MSKQEKLLRKLANSRNTFLWTDLVILLSHLGYKKQEMAGSRVRFYNSGTSHMFRLHKPPPGNYIKGGALKDVKSYLIQEGYL